MSKEKIKKLAGILITIVFLSGVLYQADWEKIWLALTQLNGANVAACVLFFGISCIFRALMWRLTTAHLAPAGLSVLYGGVIVGYMANNVLPLRVGEFVRAYYLSRRIGIPAMSAFSTVCIERIFDVISLGFFLFAAMMLGISGLSGREPVMLLILSFIVTTTACLYFITYPPNWVKSFFSSYLLRFENLFKPLKQLRQGKKVTALLVLSIASWLCNYVSFIALVSSFPNIHFEGPLLLLLYTNFANLIPSSPGGLGVMQVAFWMALVPYGFAKEEALAYSFAYQAILLIFNFAVGMPYFLRTNLGMKTMYKDAVLEDNGNKP